MKDKISKYLDRIERDNRVKIILACESGSRAWGFPSRDSDYDVRFIYVNPRDWYLGIGEKRDVIELPIDGELDISGWDLKKALQLLRKSNSALLEWLSSPIRYRVWNAAADAVSELSERGFLPRASYSHYLSMARNRIFEIENREEVKIKTYMYAVRAILCCRWVVRHGSPPPMHIDDLIRDLLRDGELEKVLGDMMRLKKESAEKAVVQRSPVIERYLAGESEALGELAPEKTSKSAVETFDGVFRKILGEVII